MKKKINFIRGISICGMSSSNKPLVRRMTNLICRRKVLCVIFVAFVLYLFLRLKYYKVKFEAVIERTSPVQVWDFVGDFNNMMRLNPTIISFHIHDESGDYNSWIYTVSYTEHLSHIPFLYNLGRAEFDVRRHSDSIYIIDSKHETCFITKFTCLKSSSFFKFEPLENDTKSTKYVEHITYQCPVLLSYLCQLEVLYQREMIATNLQKTFDEKNLIKTTN